jgi:copper(I)-binding protein
MENGVMKMRMLDTLPLKANTPVNLSPGGFHLMLFDLENPLKVGDQVRFTLHFKDQQGKELTVTADSEVKEE